MTSMSTTLPLGLLVLGFGGHARSVADVALACGIKKLVFVDFNAKAGEQLLGFNVIVNKPEILPADWAVFPAAGDNKKRQEQYLEVQSKGWPLATLVAPTASIGTGSTVLPGTLVAHHAHIGPMAKVGYGCIINTGAVIEHEAQIGNYCHISVNSTVAGRCHIGQKSFIGAAATIIDGISLCDEVILGAGGCVVSNISEPGTYIGIPARKIK